MELTEYIKDRLDNLDERDLVAVFNEYCCTEDKIYDRMYFDDITSGMPTSEVLDLIDYDEFKPFQTYFRFSDKGKIESTNYLIKNDWIDLEELAVNIAYDISKAREVCEELKSDIDDWEMNIVCHDGCGCYEIAEKENEDGTTTYTCEDCGYEWTE